MRIKAVLEGRGFRPSFSVKTNSPLLMAPFGATSVLIFGVPDSPLAQPRNVIGAIS
jgi:CBS-domain-containing membrane protein